MKHFAITEALRYELANLAGMLGKVELSQELMAAPRIVEESDGLSLPDTDHFSITIRHVRKDHLMTTRKVVLTDMLLCDAVGGPESVVDHFVTRHMRAELAK